MPLVVPYGVFKQTNVTYPEYFKCADYELPDFI